MSDPSSPRSMWEGRYSEELDRDVIEGAGHSGIGAVVQFIARKPG